MERRIEPYDNNAHVYPFDHSKLLLFSELLPLAVLLV